MGPVFRKNWVKDIAWQKLLWENITSLGNFCSASDWLKWFWKTCDDLELADWSTVGFHSQFGFCPRIWRARKCNWPNFALATSVDKAKLTSSTQENLSDAIRERNQAVDQLRTMESAFSDLYGRYEKAKSAVETFQKVSLAPGEWANGHCIMQGAA